MNCPYGLIADIGGTNARFAIADDKGYYEEIVLKCAEFSGPAEMAKAYLEMTGRHDVTRGSFAIAGPVDGDFFFSVNLPWRFSITELGTDIGFDKLKLYNDFTAIAKCIPFLKENDVSQCGGEPGNSPGSAMAVIGPGTGLGMGGVISGNGEHYVVPGEGGHSTVPVRTVREFGIFRLLEEKYTHVSAERMCSGQGLENIYNALRLIDGKPDLPELRAPEISSAALDGSCGTCGEALDMMMMILGRVAGNLVMMIGAWQGVYIAGGIIGRLGEYFFSSPFRKEFESKGRFSQAMSEVPAYVILHPQPALLGLQSDFCNEKD